MDEQTGTQGGRPALALRIALMVLLLGLAVGAALGWTSGAVTYRAQCFIYIAPSEPHPAAPGDEQVLPRFEAFVDAQVDLLKAPRLASLALTSDAWQRGGEAGMEVAAFLEQRRIVHKQRTQHIQVAFLHGQPEIALAGVQALLGAYEQLTEDLSPGGEQPELASARIVALRAKLLTVQEAIMTLTTDYGGVDGLVVSYESAVEALEAAERELAEVRRAIAAGGTPEQLEALKQQEQRLAAHVESMRAQLLKLTEARGELGRLQKEAKSLETEIERLTVLKETLEAQQQGEGRIRIWDRGLLPTEPFQDTRLAGALRGGALGALPGFLLILGVGIFGMRAIRRRRDD